MTPDRIAELRALCDAATKGPWRHSSEGAGWAVLGPEWEHLVQLGELDTDLDLAVFIAAARTALPEALDEIERLRKSLMVIRCETDDPQASHWAGAALGEISDD